MKKLIVIGSGLLIIAAVAWLKLSNTAQTANQTTIGILQTASHPALDQAREGFKKQVHAALGKNIQFIEHNFEGNSTNGLLMAQSLANDPHVACIYAIATPAAQLAVSIEQQKPIVIAAVTNPKILAEEGNIPENLYGATDMIDVQAQVKTIKTLLPQIHKIGIVYNQAEANATYLHEAMKEAMSTAGIEVMSIGVSSEAELGNQVKYACAQVDAVIAPTDNLIIAAAGYVNDICLASKKPFIVSDPPSVANGPLMAAGGVDYTKSGIIAGTMATQLLQGRKPDERFVNATQIKTIVNKKTMDALGLKLPLENIEFVK